MLILNDNINRTKKQPRSVRNESMLDSAVLAGTRMVHLPINMPPGSWNTVCVCVYVCMYM